jgi:hypothetical protein
MKLSWFTSQLSFNITLQSEWQASVMFWPSSRHKEEISSIYGQHCIQQGYLKDKATIAFNVSDIFNS